MTQQLRNTYLVLLPILPTDTPGMDITTISWHRSNATVVYICPNVNICLHLTSQLCTTCCHGLNMAQLTSVSLGDLITEPLVNTRPSHVQSAPEQFRAAASDRADADCRARNKSWSQRATAKPDLPVFRSVCFQIFQI